MQTMMRKSVATPGATKPTIKLPSRNMCRQARHSVKRRAVDGSQNIVVAATATLDAPPKEEVQELQAAVTGADVDSSDSPATDVANLLQEVAKPVVIPERKTGYKDAIMFQGFGWESHTVGNWYGVVQSKISDMKALGLTHIWLPPPSRSVAPQGYMPGQYYDLRSAYGNQDQLKQLTRALKEAGISPIADIVINHRCADAQHDGVWNNFQDTIDHPGRNIDWNQWAVAGTDGDFGGQGNPDTGADFPGAPDIDHLNPEVRKGLKDWLAWLKKEIGFDSFRFDFVKGYAPRFIKEYVDASVGSEVLNVGELWTDLNWGDNGLEYNQDGPRQACCDWIDGAQKSSTAFDFPTKGILQEAVRNCQYWRLVDPQGKAPGLIGWWPEKAVTFIDNHDTGSTQSHWPFPSDKVTAGYAYILTHPGIPCIFWEHMFDWGDDVRDRIKNLMDIRKRAGILSDSKMKILVAEADLYMANIDDRLIVKLGPRIDLGDRKPNKAEGWQRVADGFDYCVWEKKSATSDMDAN